MNEANLGEYLRKEREKRNITLEQIASSTKINIRLLQALEADHYRDLPALPFVRGFITAYARALGLDVQAILTHYQPYLKDRYAEVDGPQVRAPEVLLDRREGERTKTMLWLVMGGFIVVGGLVMILLKPALRHKRQSTLDKLKASHVVEPSATPLPTSTATPSPAPTKVAVANASVATMPGAAQPSPSPSPSVKPDPMFKGDDLKPNEVKVKVIIRAKEDLWVRYRVDGKESRRFVLRASTQLVMKGTQAVRIQVGDAAKAELRYKTADFAPFQDIEGIQLKNGSPTLVFPPGSEAASEADPFPGATALPSGI